MTDTAVNAAEGRAQPAASAGPGQRGEFLAGREILAGRRAADRIGPVRLLRPGGAGQAEVLGLARARCDRRLRAFLIDIVLRRVPDVVVSLTARDW